MQNLRLQAIRSELSQHLSHEQTVRGKLLARRILATLDGSTTPAELAALAAEARETSAGATRPLRRLLAAALCLEALSEQLAGRDDAAAALLRAADRAVREHVVRRGSRGRAIGRPPEGLPEFLALYAAAGGYRATAAALGISLGAMSRLAHGQHPTASQDSALRALAAQHGVEWPAPREVASCSRALDPAWMDVPRGVAS